MSRFRSILLALIPGVVMWSAIGPNPGRKSQVPSQVPVGSILIKIEPAGFGRDEPHVYPRNKPISIRCSIHNTSRKSVPFRLKDHDAYHGTLPYPVEVSAQIVQDNGTIITANDIDRSGEGWWSQYFLWSTSFDPLMPGDTILIPPGGVVVRQIPLDQVVSMAPGAKDGLLQGTYLVKLRLNGLYSNQITIKIGLIE